MRSRSSCEDQLCVTGDQFVAGFAHHVTADAGAEFEAFNAYAEWCEGQAHDDGHLQEILAHLSWSALRRLQLSTGSGILGASACSLYRTCHDWNSWLWFSRCGAHCLQMMTPVADLAATPSSIDWSEMGATTPVKDQGQCGSCWAFSTTEGIESAIYMAQGTLPELAVQQIILCDKSDGGCQGEDLPTLLPQIPPSLAVTWIRRPALTFPQLVVLRHGLDSLFSSTISSSS